MAWLHKEGDWCLDGTWNNYDGQSWFTPSIDLGQEGKNEDGLSFTKWLDLECERDGSWEVLKISRRFGAVHNTSDKSTWVVFRQKI